MVVNVGGFPASPAFCSDFPPAPTPDVALSDVNCLFPTSLNDSVSAAGVK